MLWLGGEGVKGAKRQMGLQKALSMSVFLLLVLHLVESS